MPTGIIADGGVDVGARGGHVGQPTAQAIADRADLAAADRLARGADRRLEVADACVLVETAHQAERALQLLGHVGIELDVRLQSPEQVGRDSQIPGGGERVALAADTLVDAKDLLDDDDRRPGPARRVGAVSGEATGIVQRLDNHRGHPRSP